jgi:hypothetical protein
LLAQHVRRQVPSTIKYSSVLEEVCAALQELDVDAEMQRGLLPGAVALSGKFVPVLQSVSQRTLNTAREFLADPSALSERVHDGLAATGSAVREHIAPDAHSATAGPGSTAGGTT